jgi:hypothetical protein
MNELEERFTAAATMDTEMPGAGMADAPPGTEMPGGRMMADDHAGFTPVSGEMPRGEMEALGAGLPGRGTAAQGAALSEMPGGGMGAIEAGAAAAPSIEIRGSWRLLLSSDVFESEGRS